MRTCVICKQLKPLDQMETAREGKHGRGSRCKACNLIRRKKMRQRCKEKWSSANPYKEHDTGNKRCCKCKKQLDIEAFSLCTQNTDGLQNTCKKCQVIHWQESNYGISLKPEDVCAICGNKNGQGHERLGIDHCHNTGKTRGVLCARCNFGIANFLDNPKLLQNAIEYLVKSSCRTPAPARASKGFALGGP